MKRSPASRALPPSSRTRPATMNASVWAAPVAASSPWTCGAGCTSSTPTTDTGTAVVVVVGAAVVVVVGAAVVVVVGATVVVGPGSATITGPPPAAASV